MLPPRFPLLSLLAVTFALSTTLVTARLATERWLDSDENAFTALSERFHPEKPYAPDLFNRGELFQVAGDSNEEQHLVKRAKTPCSQDSECQSNQYCSSKKKLCYIKIADGSKCSRDAACASGFCSARTFKCLPARRTGSKCSRNASCASGYCNARKEKCAQPKDIGLKCHGNDGACKSGYCSVKTNRCHPKSGPGGHCASDRTCQKGYHCLNRTCQPISTTSSSSTPGPTSTPPPSPSGTHNYPRSLSQLI